MAIPIVPPLEDSDFSATALSVRALRAYARNGVREEADLRVHVARSWLTESETEINEDKVYRLLGLRWADAGGRPLGSAMDALIADQREDGGWAQEPGMESDAYATGQALVALRQGGELAVSDEVYRRGVEFLMVTQKGDGSWLVRSRDYPQACQSVLRERFPARRVAVHLRRRDLVGRHGARARQRALAIQPLDFSQEMPP